MVRYPQNRYEIKLPMLPDDELRVLPVDALEALARTAAPLGPYSTPYGLAVVTARSPMRHRRAVERLGIFLKREEQYDFPPYGADETAEGAVVSYLWTTDRYPEWGPKHALWHVFGACCFRWREWTNAPSGWALHWIWLHPYERRRGHLTRAWPYFRAKFGEFLVEPPLSPAMQLFLAKVEPAAIDAARDG